MLITKSVFQRDLEAIRADPGGEWNLLNTIRMSNHIEHVSKNSSGYERPEYEEDIRNETADIATGLMADAFSGKVAGDMACSFYFQYSKFRNEGRSHEESLDAVREHVKETISQAVDDFIERHGARIPESYKANLELNRDFYDQFANEVDIVFSKYDQRDLDLFRQTYLSDKMTLAMDEGLSVEEAWDKISKEYDEDFVHFSGDESVLAEIRASGFIDQYDDVLKSSNDVTASWMSVKDALRDDPEARDVLKDHIATRLDKLQP